MTSLNYQHMNKIITNDYGHALWLGDLVSAEEIEHLKINSIKTVISAIEKSQLIYPNGSMIRVFKYPIQDSKTQKINKYFDEVSDIIEKSLKFGSVLVHCAAGVSRSTTLVIAYLISKYKMTFRQALKLCKQKRPEICPNLNFQLQLKTYQESIKHKVQLKNVTTSKESFEGLKNNSMKRQSDKVKNSTLSIQGNGIKSINNSSLMNVTQKGNFNTPQNKSKFQQLSPQYLKQIALFRFGITNFDPIKKH